MDLNTIRDALRHEPFVSFTMCLADGRRVLVKHPEFVAMNKRIVVVLDEDSCSRTVEPLLIVSIEQQRGPSARGKGKQKKRPKT